jgi:ankyrin repeat protein
MSFSDTKRLFAALESGDVEEAARLVRQGVDLNVVHRNQSLLNLALERRHYSLLPLLLAHGADPNLGSPLSRLKPIHVAIESGRPDLVSTLIERKAALDVRTADGLVLLEYCLQHNNRPDVAKVIVEANQKQKGVWWSIPRKTLMKYQNPPVRSYLLLKARTSTRPGSGYKEDPDLLAEIDLLMAERRVDVLDFLLQEGLDIDRIYEDGTTLLVRAVDSGNLTMVNHLLATGASPNLSAPLERALEKGNNGISYRLVRAGAKVEKIPPGKFLVELVQSRHLPLVSFVLASKNPLELGLVPVTSNATTSPLHEAAKWGEMDVVRQLIGLGAPVDLNDSQSNIPIFYAIEAGQTELAQLLYSRGKRNISSTDKRTPLHVSAKSNQGEILSWLMDPKHKLNPDVFDRDGNPPINWAIVNGNLAMCQQLEFPGMIHHTNKQGYSALHWAAKSGHVDILHWLVRKGADLDALNKSSQSPSLLCVKNGHVEAFLYLFGQGASIAQRDKAGNSVLKLAVSQRLDTVVETIKDRLSEIDLSEAIEILTRGDPGIAKLVFGLPLRVNEPIELALLVKWILSKSDSAFYGAIKRHINVPIPNLPAGNLNSATPLHHAVYHRNGELIDWLIANGADLDATDGARGRTSLMIAAYSSFNREANLLIRSGADPNIVSKDTGDTALNWAADRGNLGLVKCLLSNGADPNLRNVHGSNALDVANFRRQPAIVKLLQESATLLEDPPVHPLNWTGDQDCLESPLTKKLPWKDLMNSLGKADQEELCHELVEMIKKGEGEDVRQQMTTHLTDSDKWDCQLCGEHLMAEGHDEVALDGCNHFFHKDCMDEHLEENDSCPISGQRYKEKWVVKNVEHRVDCEFSD